MINRRRLMVALTNTAALAGVSFAPSALAMPIIPSPSVNNPSTPPNLGRSLDLNSFAALLGQRFRLRNETGTWFEAILHAVRDEGCCATLEQFSAVFRLAPDTDVSEAIYTVAHRWAGKCSVLLSPSGDNEHERYLTATFSLLRTGAV